MDLVGFELKYFPILVITPVFSLKIRKRSLCEQQHNNGGSLELLSDINV